MFQGPMNLMEKGKECLITINNTNINTQSYIDA